MYHDCPFVNGVIQICSRPGVASVENSIFSGVESGTDRPSLPENDGRSSMSRRSTGGRVELEGVVGSVGVRRRNGFRDCGRVAYDLLRRLGSCALTGIALY